MVPNLLAPWPWRFGSVALVKKQPSCTGFEETENSGVLFESGFRQDRDNYHTTSHILTADEEMEQLRKRSGCWKDKPSLPGPSRPQS